MKKYFEALTSQDEIKKRFKELAKAHHPDAGGCDGGEIMKEINHQYDQVLQGIYQREGKSISEIDELLKNSKEVREKLYDILQVSGIVVELCGSWIWITGDTKAVKETLKEMGCRWSNEKQAWYWHNSERRRWKGPNKWNLDMIRDRHGSEVIKTKEYREKIA
jgi:hypothetical protein